MDGVVYVDGLLLGSPFTACTPACFAVIKHGNCIDLHLQIAPRVILTIAPVNLSKVQTPKRLMEKLILGVLVDRNGTRKKVKFSMILIHSTW